MPEESPLQRLRRLESAEKPPAPPGGARAGKFALGAGFLYLLGKLKFAFLAFKLLPLLGTLATMALSIQVYSASYGWPLAAGMVGLILLHELGHGAAAKRLGLKVGAPVFIPFFGAVIALKEQPRSTWVECLVAAGGPAAGLFGAAACAAAAALNPERAGYLLALAHLTATINLFNLLPAAGLDGDRITQPFEREHWIGALLALCAVCAGASAAAGKMEAVTLMILIVAAVKAWRTLRTAPKRLIDRLAEAGRYGAEETDTTPARRRAASLIYIGLAVSLAALTVWAGGRAERSPSNLISFESVKRLYLMRHGHSPSPAEAGVKTDALRPLSDKGRGDAGRMAAEIAKRGGMITLVLHSPLVRAVQTAAAAAAVLNAEPQPFKPLDNSLPPDEALAKLTERAAPADDVLAVGHQPQIGEIAALLTGEIFDIRPAGVVAVELGPEPRLLWAANVDELA